MTWTHGIGSPVFNGDQYITNLREHYIEAMGQGHTPAMLGWFFGIPGKPYRWPTAMQQLDELLVIARDGNLALNICMELRYADKSPSDNEIIDGTYDGLLREVLDKLVAVPTVRCYLRVGGEINRPGVHIADRFPLAFSHVSAMVPSAADHIQVVWCLDPSGVWPFSSEWMPDSNTFDVFGIDLFNKDHFVPLTNGTGMPSTPQSLMIWELFRRAETASKPVLIGEVAPIMLGATSAEWWDPFWLLVDRYGNQIDAITFQPVDYAGTTNPTWGDCRYHLDPDFVAEFQQAMDAAGGGA